MKNYLTIGEFAKLRSVNVNSLLYYERLGILKPIYTDPKTKYRYYAPEQLSSLDIILLCISLDIPLKELKKYQDEGCYWQKKMLEDGKRIAEEKICSMQIDLKKIEYAMKCQEDQDVYSGCKGIYKREFTSRLFITEEYIGDLNNITKFGKISTGLFDYAERKGFSAVTPTGFMFVFFGGDVTQYLFYEILPTKTSDTKIMKIPKGTYSCMQIEFEPERNYHEFLAQNFGNCEKRIAIVSNLIRDKLKIDSRYNEIQVLDGYSPTDS